MSINVGADTKHSIVIIEMSPMQTLEIYGKKTRCQKTGGNVLRAGCNSPPAVMTRNAFSPRALDEMDGIDRPLHQGQQTRCDSGADGHSPDERERDSLAWQGCEPLVRLISLLSVRPVFSPKQEFVDV